MDAKNTKTGEIVENFIFSHEYGTVSYIDSNGLLRFGQPKDGEWEIIKPKFDPKDWMTKGQIIVEENKWSVFRREAARSILAGLVGNLDEIRDRHIKINASLAVEFADALIAELRKDEKHQTLE